MKPHQLASPRERGFTLAEILVAVAVFALIFIAALMIYDRSNLEFKRGVQAADTQQNTRVAFDRLVADIRMAGFDYDRDGIPTATGGTIWQASKNYAIANIVSPTVANGFVYRAVAISGTAPYTSGAAQPIWPTTVGNTVVDNELTWRTESGINQFQQPDEQVEFAGPTAITLRSNFDYEIDVVNENGREPDLQTGQFPVVTTGNDEIVTYALRKYNPDGTLGTNPSSIQFFADVQPIAPYRRAHPGGVFEQPILITDVDLTNASPPYTLMKFTFSTAGAVVGVPVANNIRRLDLQYYTNTTGVPSAPVPPGWNPADVVVDGFTHPPGTQLVDPGGGQFNPAVTTSGIQQRAARSLIRGVRLILVGMDEASDFNYTNPAETTASPAKSFRTYRVESLVVPRNIGKQGMREPTAAPPGEPILQSVCVGHCGIAQVAWLAPSPDPAFGQVEQYIIQYGTTAGGPYPSVKQVGTASTGYVGGLTPGTTYYFTVSAVNSYGSTPAKSTIVAGQPDYVSGTPLNRTTPQPPTSFSGSGGGGANPVAQQNQITVSWSAPIGNVSPDDYIQCRTPAGAITTVQPVNIAPGEIIDYRVYRSTNSTFAATAPDQIPSGSPNQLIFGVGTVSFIDKTAPNCSQYYYRVQALEACDLLAENIAPAVGWSTIAPSTNPAVLAESTLSAAADAPTSLKATVGVTCNASKCDAHLEWLKVKADVALPPNAIVIRDYEISRQKRKVEVDVFNVPLPGPVWMDDGPPVTWIHQDTTPLVGQYVTYDDLQLDLKDGFFNPHEYIYTVRALQCSTQSLPSPAVKFPCTFTGAVTVAPNVSASSDGNGLTSGTAWLVQSPGITVDMDGTGITSVQAFLNDGISIIDLGTDNSAPYSFPIVGTQDGVVYSVELIARDATNCFQSIVRYIEESTPSGCCLSALADDAFVISYTPGLSQFDIFFRNLCDDPLDIQEALPDAVRIGWTVPAGAIMTTADFPNSSGGVVTKTLNDSSGTVLFSPPVGFLDPVPAASNTYKVTLKFNLPITTATAPITSMCLTYQRPGVDTINQNCKFIPQPTTPNSCL